MFAPLDFDYARARRDHLVNVVFGPTLGDSTSGLGRCFQSRCSIRTSHLPFIDRSRDACFAALRRPRRDALSAIIELPVALRSLYAHALKVDLGNH
jgi:hypothetical protein